MWHACIYSRVAGLCCSERAAVVANAVAGVAIAPAAIPAAAVAVPPLPCPLLLLLPSLPLSQQMLVLMLSYQSGVDSLHMLVDCRHHTLILRSGQHTNNTTTLPRSWLVV